MGKFDASAEVAKLQERTKRRRKIRRYGVSRLDKYRDELLKMREAGATLAQLQMWLRSHRIKVASTTISRFLKKHG